MKKYTSHQIDSVALAERREQSVRLYQSGKCKSYKEIGEIVGAHPITIGKWIRSWKKDGLRQLKKVNKGGRPIGCCRRLLPHEESRIKKDLVDHCPDQLKLPFALWTRQAVRLHIKSLFEIELPIRTVGEYLKRWGFTPQKPVKRAYQRSDVAVQKWLDEQFPAIKKQAKEEDADIFWGDETGIRNDESKGRSYAPKGKTPVQMVNPVPEKINMISAISNQGKLHFMFYRETMSAQKMIEFMERVIHDNERKVFLILDNLRVHHSKVLDEFLKENVAFIKLFFLPSYSPDLNPDEYLNRDLKANLNNKPLGRAKGKSEKHAQSHMKDLSINSEHVTRLFHAESVLYAS